MAETQAVTQGNNKDLPGLWKIHQAAEWPGSVGPREGELMTLDTVVSGCVTYFLEEHHLDPQRVAILEDCLSDLETALLELSEEPPGYFERVKQLGALLLEAGGLPRSIDPGP